MSERIRVLSVDIDNLSYEGLFLKLDKCMEEGKPCHIATVNAEFLVAAERDVKFRDILWRTHINTADGIGVLWAAKFLSMRSYAPRLKNIFFSTFQLIFSLAFVMLRPSSVKSDIQKKISGSELIWRMCKYAQDRDLSVFFLGGYGDTSKVAARVLHRAFPSLRIVGSYAGSPREEGIAARVNAAETDILFVAYGQVRQEKWIDANLANLRIKAAIGVGGSFDYVAGKKPYAPRFLRHIGLEWAFRLATQPYRLSRIWNAVPVFVSYAFRYKLLRGMPYRRSITAYITNRQGQVLVCRRSPERSEGSGGHWQLPRGGVEKGESDPEALKREMKEELGLDRLDVRDELKDFFRYEWSLYFAGIYGNSYRGQMLSAMRAFFDEHAQTITLDNKEFDAYEWVRPEMLLERVHPVQRPAAALIYENFRKSSTLP